MLDELLELIPPPKTPLEVPPIKYRWDYAVTIPDDYWAFLQCYGNGTFGDFSWYNPHSQNPHRNLFNQLLHFHLNVGNWHEMGELLDFRPFPGAGSYLPIASTGTGQTVFWSIGRAPTCDQWKITTISFDDLNGTEGIVHYDYGWVEFLVRAFRREIGTELNGLHPEFEPSPRPKRDETEDAAGGGVNIG